MSGQHSLLLGDSCVNFYSKPCQYLNNPILSDETCYGVDEFAFEPIKAIWLNTALNAEDNVTVTWYSSKSACNANSSDTFYASPITPSAQCLDVPTVPTVAFAAKGFYLTLGNQGRPGAKSLSQSPVSGSKSGVCSQITRHKLSPAAIAGIVVGITIIVVSLVGVLIFWYRKRFRNSSKRLDDDSVPLPLSRGLEGKAELPEVTADNVVSPIEEKYVAEMQVNEIVGHEAMTGSEYDRHELPGHGAN